MSAGWPEAGDTTKGQKGAGMLSMDLFTVNIPDRFQSIWGNFVFARPLTTVPFSSTES